MSLFLRTSSASVRLPLPLIVFAAAYAFLLACLPRHGIGLYDEGFILLNAQRVLEGEVPYRDFWGMYAPGQFYALAGLFKLFGSSVLVERLWDLAARAGVVLMVFLWARRLDAGIYAHPAWIVALVVLGGTPFYGFPIFQSLLFCLAGGYLVLRALDGAKPALWLFSAGICAGFATLFRHDMGFYLIVAETITIAVWTLRADAAPSGLPTVLRRLMPLAGGTLLIFAPAVVFLLIEVPPRDLWFNLFYVPSSVYPKVRAVPFPPLPDPAALIRREFVPFNEALQVYFPLLASAGGLAYCLIAARDGADREAALRRIGVLLLTLIISLLYLKGLVRISGIHVVQSFVPAVALAFVLLARLKMRALRIASAAALAAVLAVAPAQAATDTAHDKAWTLRALRNAMGLRLAIPRYCAPEPGLERARCFTPRLEDLPVIALIQSRTRPNEPIYVGLTRHDRVLISNVSLYYLSGRRSATKWHETHPGVHTTAAVQADMIREFDATRVRLLVLSAEWDGIREPNASAISSGVTLLDDHIRANFTQVQEFGPTQIWERRN